MLRHALCRRCVDRSGRVAAAYICTTRVCRAEQDPVEREREKELRQQVLQKYKGMQIPEMTNFEYGHFSSGGIQRAAARQAMGDGFANVFSNSSGTGSEKNCNSGSCGPSGCGGGSGIGANGAFGSGPGVFKVDWLMLFTGVALMYVSGKVLYNQMTRKVDDLDFPLWTASLERQAQHLLFCVQFDEQTREGLKREFQNVRQANPFTDFFEWVRSRRPEFCSGNRHSPDMAIGAVVGGLSGTNSRELMTFATSLRQSLGRSGGDPLSRVDDFLDKLQVTGSVLNAARGGWGGAGSFPAPPQNAPAAFPQPSKPMDSSPMTFTPEIAEGSQVHGSNPFEHFEDRQKSQ